MSVLVSMETGQTPTEIEFKIYAQDASKFEPQYCKLEGMPSVRIIIDTFDKRKSILEIMLQGCNNQLQMFKAIVMAGQKIGNMLLECDRTFDSLSNELALQTKKLKKFPTDMQKSDIKQNIQSFMIDRVLSCDAYTTNLVSLFGVIQLHSILLDFTSEISDAIKLWIGQRVFSAGQKAVSIWMPILISKNSVAGTCNTLKQSETTSARPEDKAGGETAHISSQLSDKFGVSLTSPVDAIQPGDPVLKSEIDFFTEIREINKDDDAIKLIDKVEPLVKDYLRHADSKTESKNNQVSLVLKAAKDLLKCAGYSQLKVNQVFAVMAGLNKNPKRKLLMEISTGEGKSAICRLLAACYRELNSKKIDIISSSPILAQRESEESAKFYRMRYLAVKNCIGFGDLSVEDKNKDNVYATGDVLIGTVHSFSTDQLSDVACDHKYDPPEDMHEIMKDLGYAEGRQKNMLIVDEADNMFIDEKRTDTMLTSKRDTINALDHIVYEVWRLMQEMFTAEPKNIEEVTDLLIKTLEEGKFFKDLRLNSSITQRWNIGKKLMVQSAYSARYYFKENIHYKVNQMSKSIQIVDKDNTGEIRKAENRWSNHLHEFLELKHSLPVSRTTDIEGIKTVVGFFDDYGPNVVGMTGTLGNKQNKDFLTDSYDAVCLHVPKSNTNRQMVYDPVVGMPYTIDGQLFKVITQELVEYTADQIRGGRPCLIMAPSMSDANALKGELESVLGSLGLRYVNVVSYMDSEQDKGKVEDQLDLSTVVVSTALGGRGTDFKLTEDAKKAGGLATILTYVTDSFRVEKQIQGRSARNGENGSFIMIVPKSHIHDCKSIEDRVEIRDKAEMIKMQNDTMQVKDQKKLQSDMNAFVAKYKEFKKSEPSKAHLFKMIFMEKISTREQAIQTGNKEAIESLSDVNKLMKESLDEIHKSGKLNDPSKPECEHAAKFNGELMDKTQAREVIKGLQAKFDIAGFKDKEQIGCVIALAQIQSGDNEDAKKTMEKVDKANKDDALSFMVTRTLQDAATMKRTIEEGTAHVAKNFAKPIKDKLKKLSSKLQDKSMSGLHEAEKFISHAAQSDKKLKNLSDMLSNADTMKAKARKQAESEWIKSDEDNREMRDKINGVIAHNTKPGVKDDEKVIFKNVDDAIDLTMLEPVKVPSDNKGYEGYLIGALMAAAGVGLMVYSGIPIFEDIGFNLLGGGIDMGLHNYKMNDNGTYNLSDVLKCAAIHSGGSIASPLIDRFIVPQAEKMLNKTKLNDKLVGKLKEGMLFYTKKSVLTNFTVKLMDDLECGLEDNKISAVVSNFLNVEKDHALKDSSELKTKRDQNNENFKKIMSEITKIANSIKDSQVLDMLQMNIGHVVYYAERRTNDQAGYKKIFEVIKSYLDRLISEVKKDQKICSTDKVPEASDMLSDCVSRLSTIAKEMASNHTAEFIKGSQIYSHITKLVLKSLQSVYNEYATESQVEEFEDTVGRPGVDADGGGDYRRMSPADRQAELRRMRDEVKKGRQLADIADRGVHNEYIVLKMEAFAMKQVGNSEWSGKEQEAKEYLNICAKDFGDLIGSKTLEGLCQASIKYGFSKNCSSFMSELRTLVSQMLPLAMKKLAEHAINN